MGSQQLKLVDEALLKRPANKPVAKDSRDHGTSVLTIIGLIFLTFNSGMAVYRSNGDTGAIFFVGFSYADLVSLFYCLRLYESTPPESSHREHLKMAVWLLTTMLTTAFSYKVAAIMPFPVQVLVWSMAGATVLGGFYAFFFQLDKTCSIWYNSNMRTEPDYNLCPGESVGFVNHQCHGNPTVGPLMFLIPICFC